MAKLKEQKLPLQVLKKFRLIYGSVRQQFRQIEESCGISGSQLWLLQEIANTPGVGVSELAERLSIHQSTCSQLVEKLANRRLILKKRSKEDQRRVGLFPTASAMETLSRAPGPAEGILPEALTALPDDVLKALDASLTEVISQLRVRDEKFAEKPLSDL
ncbi:MAG: MarR family transcriptional regulator [Georgfuchsia sp.]